MSLTATVTTGRAQYATGRPIEITLGLHNAQPWIASLRVFREWEYDIVVRDTGRRVVWQWSRGKRMPSRPYEVQVDPRGCRETRERWDGCDDRGRPVAPGVYVIEARLYPCRPVFTTVTILDQPRDERYDRDRYDRDRDDRYPGERGFFASLRCEPRSASVGEEVDVVYTLSNQSFDSVLYQFPSGQVYELEARLRGRCVWRWSDGRAFTRSLTQFYLSAGSRKEFHISFPIVRGTAPGDYELVAYLVPTGYVRGSAGEATCRLRVR
jgi:hypothetical protein